MPTYTLRPNADTYEGGYVVTGTANHYDALDDDNDATYIRKGSVTNYCYFACTTATLGTDERVVGTSPHGRYKRPSSSYTAIFLARIGTSSGDAGSQYPATVSTATTLAANPASGAMLKALAQTDINDLTLVLTDYAPYTDSNRATFYEGAITVYSLEKPTVTADAPSGTITTSTPTIETTCSSVVDTWQDTYGLYLSGDYEIKVFSDAQYGAGGFDPATSESVWETTGTLTQLYVDGTTAGDVAVDVVSGDLPDDTYRAYVRWAREVPVHSTQTDFWSEWAYTGFEVDAAPADPTFTATADATNQRVTLAVTPATEAAMSDPLITVQRSVNGGAYETVRTCNAVAGTEGSASTFYDYEADRGGTISYRARCTYTTAGGTGTSAWVAATATLAATGWNLKCPANPAINAININVLAGVPETQVESQGVFTPKGSDRPVVVAGDMYGVDGSYTIIAIGTTQITALEALLAYQGTLYMDAGFGDSKYIRVTSRAWTRRGTGASPVRIYTVGYLEVAAPAV